MAQSNLALNDTSGPILKAWVTQSDYRSLQTGQRAGTQKKKKTDLPSFSFSKTFIEKNRMLKVTRLFSSVERVMGPPPGFESLLQAKGGVNRRTMTLRVGIKCVLFGIFSDPGTK